MDWTRQHLRCIRCNWNDCSWMAHDVVAPPLIAGVVVVIAVPFSKVKLWAPYTMVLGGTSLMVMFRVVEVEPPELLAQTV